jgi:cytochrome c peroxidase
MKPTRLFLLAPALAALFLSACSTDWHDHKLKGPPGKAITGPDWYGDSAERLVWLDQGWSREDSNWFYTTTQGSQLLPYPFFIALEQERSTEPFRDVRHMQKYRYLPERPGPGNRDGLPIGFVADAGSSLPRKLVKDQRSLGFTCAACHTTQINYQGTAMRIDGGPTMADFEGFLIALTGSLQATAKDDAKFSRFAAKVLGSGADEAKKTELHAELRRVAAERAAYDKVNASNVAYGFARLDAFGRIFNNALTLVDKRNGVKPNASVSYPHLWDSPREDVVQWTGIASNAGIGPLTRNVGEVVGVFAHINPGSQPPDLGYTTSVRLRNLIALEDRLKGLESPVWPAKILGRIDGGLKAKGAELFQQNCGKCHNEIDRDAPNRKAITTVWPIKDLETDPLTARNIIDGRGKTGFLKGTFEYVITGEHFGDEASALAIVTNTVLRTLIGQVTPFRVSENERLIRLQGELINRKIDPKTIVSSSGDGAKMQYKARPLNGIWATAPYLHNGSVPNLAELLLPADQRSKKFAIGRREFDPQNVGFQTAEVPGVFTFDTSRAGNSNSGHTYGTTLSPEDRKALLEYLKSI